VNNIVLVGFMGSGKTTVGERLAERMGRRFIDLDQEIARDAGRSIAEIFAQEGETGFRERETRGLEQVLKEDGAVIAAGGGAPLRDSNWRDIRERGCVVALTAEPAELARRLNGSHGRPLLRPDPRSAIGSLLPSRMSRYLEADLVVPTDGKAPAQVAAEIESQLPAASIERIPVAVPGAAHDAVVGTRLSGLVASHLRRLNPSGPALIVSDAVVAASHAAALTDAIEAIGLAVRLHLVPAGEAAKELAVLAGIYDSLGSAGVDRDGALLALGGGTVGDVAGFAAATWLRGIRYVQMPTTLLAMVDSSIGGKTAINLAAGKNLAGAVHQPTAVFCDLNYLATLPDDDYQASLAEVIKTALIADAAFVAWLATNLPPLLRREPGVLRDAVSRSIAIKADIVTRDPQERGERALLNYGHTVGHALERAAGFGALRHGVAVAWGMEVAARISVLTGACAPEVVARQSSLLRAAGLLTAAPSVDRADLLRAMRHDKKSRSGQLRWVLLRDAGRAVYGQQVEPAVVDAALSEVLGI
jgi:shikimate kinase / 3-dehydroquinate synthase